MANSNGKAAYAIAFIIFEVIIVGLVGFMANQTFIAYRELTCEDKLIWQKFNNLKQVSNDCLHEIDKRLSRIEDKLGI